MFDLFKIGFINVTLLDIVDITVVTFLVYSLYRVLRGTIAAQIFFGLIIILTLSFIAQAINLKAVGFLLRLVTDIWVIAFIILFQPEIRRLLVLLGRNRIFRMFVRSNTNTMVDIVTDAAFEMAQHQHGALMVLVRSTGIGGIVETGEPINAKISKSLIRSIFFPRSPLHDGAVIIKGEIIEAARCTLPLSSNTAFGGIPLGMRHRAGLGITEQADVVSVIVSEETGGISIAIDGKLKRGLSKETLRQELRKLLKTGKERVLEGFLEKSENISS